MTFLIARRRPAVERMARLRAAQDHAARHASRQEARFRASRSCYDLVDVVVREMGARIRSSAASAMRSSGPFAPKRTGSMPCSLRACPGSRNCWTRQSPSGRTVGRRATRSSGCTIRSVCRSISPRISPASAGWRSTAKASNAPWRRSGSARGPAARFEAKKGVSFDYPSDAERAGSRVCAIASRAIPTTRVADATVVALFDDARRQVERLDSGDDGLRRARSHAVLRRVRRPGLRHGPARLRRRRRRGRHRAWPAGAGGARAHRVAAAVAIAPGSEVTAQRRRRGARSRPAATTRPRTCFTRRCGSGSARTCGRPGRSSRRTGCGSTSRTSSR